MGEELVGLVGLEGLNKSKCWVAILRVEWIREP
jgi:hypothetical protein